MKLIMRVGNDIQREIRDPAVTRILMEQKIVTCLEEKRPLIMKSAKSQITIIIPYEEIIRSSIEIEGNVFPQH